MTNHTIDATDQPLGRLASRIAVMLRGKTHATYQPYMVPTDMVTVTNVAKVKVTGNKRTQKVHYHYSGYPGGMKARTLGVELDKRPGEVLRSTVYRMLAPNRMRDKIIKHLIIK